MAKKSITPSIRMNEEEYLKIKAIKEENNISWNELIAYVNKVLKNDSKSNKD